MKILLLNTHNPCYFNHYLLLFFMQSQYDLVVIGNTDVSICISECENQQKCELIECENKNNTHAPIKQNETVNKILSNFDNRPQAYYTSNSEKHISICRRLLFVVAELAIYLTLSLSQLIMAIIYTNQIVCNSFLPLKIWLIIQSVLDIGSTIFIGFKHVSLFTKKNIYITLIIELSITIYSILCIFQLVWLIIGSVIFWRDCVSTNPMPINVLMWCSLILGWLFWIKKAHYIKHHNNN